MNVKKFTAPSSREALRKVRESLGADAVILSNRTVNGEIEILALPSDDMAALAEPSILLLLSDLEPKLDQDDSGFDEPAFELGHIFEEFLDVLFLRVTHDPLDAGPVVPATIEDHDFPRRWQVLDVALQEQFLALVLAWRAQGHNAEGTRADPLRHPLDQSALSGGVAALADDDHTRSRFADPVLKVAKLHLQFLQFLFVRLG